MDDATRVNREFWNERADLHGQDAYYDTAGFLKGESALIQRELDEVEKAVGSVRGLDLLQLQCHFGLETLSFARMGARVTGLDFSPRAIEKAKDLASKADLDASFVLADAQQLPADLQGKFDLVYASEGCLGWIADIDRWMKSAELALKPNGHLVVIDGHPILQMMSSVEPLEFDLAYQGGEVRYEEPGSYAVPDAKTVSNETIEYSHGLAEIIDAAIRAGLLIEAVTEWTDNPRRGPDERFSEIDGTHRLRIAGQDFPCQFALRAGKPE